MSRSCNALVCLLVLAGPAAQSGTLNLHPSNSPAAPAPAEAPADTRATAPPRRATPEIAGRDEDAWREAALSRQRALASAEAALADCEAREAPAPYSDYAGYVKPIARRPGYQWVEIKHCDDARQSATDARREFADFEDQARRAGVPPGWMR